MKIAILGLGTVGSGVLEISNKLKNIQVIKSFERRITSELSTTDINDIINNPEIDIVVESLGGITPAYEYISASLKAGKHVVTANKAVVAKYLDEFITLARENKVQFIYEASVAGGIPWIVSLERTKRIDPIQNFYGIMNGTSNYIIDYMYNHNADFHTTLTKAQELGYAEKDPSADIDGDDVVNKIIVTAAVAFNYLIKDRIPQYSMRHLNKVDLDYLKSKNLSTKFIGQGSIDNLNISASAMLNIINKDSLENSVPTNFNIVSMTAETIGELKFYGQGAGKLATANAIIQDILDLESNTSREKLVLNQNYTFSIDSIKNKFLIRTSSPINSPFITKIEEFDDFYYNYTDKITFSKLDEILESITTEYLVAKFL
ncbi:MULTISPECIES: homoserine dehydrogenase [unclassified Gemella]|uniref:homoserine dehydrogenase n=1 Tax=unclassified Gemella TaxID=2624949 RepID=UPI0010747424|nr:MULTISPECIES: homoserine dehydrogenase [unclassified Gemella]MBF0709635.1 homoserine dehydrogenase [Gemella sp. GL1.1]MBF0746946.1 homoserine dehydrogenase [Gemella sp. 19428wG2_WT2a]NYS26979.1 homoserine dehydrogenase [Gemella sp. GL1]TFU59171.1 homoserine dehydrogenase [Gemella sp. WT2a]